MKRHNRKSAFKVGMVVFFFTGLMLTAQEYDWDKAEREIKRLPSSAFKELPRKIRNQLEELGCTIPQTYLSKEPHNVIQGEFARKGQKDWAVLCSKGGRSSILVFWSKPTSCPAELGWSEDRSFLQGIGGGEIGYSHHISTVGPDYILEHYEWYGGPKPPPVDHEGIDDGFAEKASVVRYCYDGKWLRLTGAD